MRQLDSPDTSHRDELVLVVLKACRADGFAHVPSFKWLVACLMALLRIESPHGADVGDQLVEVALRVPSVRAFAAERCHQMLISATQSDFAAAPPAAALRAAATALGEHGGLLPKQAQLVRSQAPLHMVAAPVTYGYSPDPVRLQAQLEALRALLGGAVPSLPAAVQAAFVQAASRLLSQLPLGTCGGGDGGSGGGGGGDGNLTGDAVGDGGCFDAFEAGPPPGAPPQPRPCPQILTLPPSPNPNAKPKRQTQTPNPNATPTATPDPHQRLWGTRPTRSYSLCCPSCWPRCHASARVSTSRWRNSK